jgi:hypothetical protein
MERQAFADRAAGTAPVAGRLSGTSPSWALKPPPMPASVRTENCIIVVAGATRLPSEPGSPVLFSSHLCQRHGNYQLGAAGTSSPDLLAVLRRTLGGASPIAGRLHFLSFSTFGSEAASNWIKARASL